MSARALPNPSANPTERSSKKPAGRASAAAKRKPRPWQEVHDSVCAGGWYRHKNPDLAHKIRLTSGNTCSLLFDLVFQNIGRQWAGKGDEPNETTTLVIEELALLLRVTAHAINEVLAYLVKRKMATVSRLAGGMVVIALHTERWAKIEDNYDVWKGKQPKPADPEAESTEVSVDEPIAVKQGVVPITRKPERVGAGCKSRAYPIKTGVKDYELDLSESPVDIEMSAAVISGRFVVKCIAHAEKAYRSNQHANQSKSTRYGDSLGSVDPGKRRNGTLPAQPEKQSTTDVKHPRAEELSALFDPLIHKWCGKTLSGDPQALLQACNAIGDTPHDVLVHDAVERAGRTLTPLHTIALCREIAHNWRKSKDMPVEKKLPTREEIDAMVAADREKRLAKEREISASRRRRSA